jgi:hypothetical protein
VTANAKAQVAKEVKRSPLRKGSWQGGQLELAARPTWKRLHLLHLSGRPYGRSS